MRVEAEVTRREDDAEWLRKDRAAWVAYRRWEDKHFPFDSSAPLKDPPGMAEARRAFEKQQAVERAKFMRIRSYGR